MSNGSRIINLDHLCAEFGQKIASAKIDEDMIREALGVLQEDGVYACFLYLLSKSEREQLKNILAEFLRQKKFIANDVTKENIHTTIGAIADSLDNIFFVKFLLERVLIYARYHAKPYAEKKE